MRRNIIISLCFCIISAISFQSCYEDKGNYDYEEINEIYFEGIEEEYSIMTGEPITIKPTIVSTISGDEGGYTYSWVIEKIWIDGEVKSLYNWSDLKEWENFDLGLPADTYVFYYIVTDTKTGIQWSTESFTIKVESDISPGFFILSEVNNIGRLDFLNYYKDALELKLDILPKIGTQLPSLDKPIKVVCGADWNSPRIGATPQEGRYMTAILTETGGYRLHPLNFSYNELYDIKKNIIGVTPKDLYVKNVIATGTETPMLDNKNNLYNHFHTQNIFWTVGGNSNVLQDGTHVNIDDKIFYISGKGALVYDIDAKSFVRQIGMRDYLTYYDVENETVFDGLHFRYNNSNKDLVYLNGRARERDDRFICYCIQKDASGSNYYLGKFELDGKQHFYRKFDGPEVAKAINFLMGPNANFANKINEFLYYYTDTKIYVYNMADMKSAELVYTAPSGSKISFASFISWGNWADDMMVFTYDESKPAESCGTMQVMKVRPAYGTLSLAEHNGQKMEWTGFGKVISAEWKNK